MASWEAYFIQGWAFTSVRSRVGTTGYESGDRWSAASEGVLAALRLSKSAQSADKVHFSDSAGQLWAEVLKTLRCINC